MTPTVTDEVRVAAAFQLINEAQAAINKAAKILDYVITRETADQTAANYTEAQDACED